MPKIKKDKKTTTIVTTTKKKERKTRIKQNRNSGALQVVAVVERDISEARKQQLREEAEWHRRVVVESPMSIIKREFYESTERWIKQAIETRQEEEEEKEKKKEKEKALKDVLLQPRYRIAGQV